MPRRSSIPTYQLLRATGQARTIIDGKDYYLGPHGSPESRQRYEELVRKVLTDRERQEIADRVQRSTSLTIAELAAAYLKHARAYYVKDGRPTTEYGNIARALRPLWKQHGYEVVTSFGPLKLMQIQADLAGRGRIVRDQVNRTVDRIRRCFKWGVSREMVPSSVYESLRTVEGLRAGRTMAPEGEGGRPVQAAHVEAVLPLVDRRIGAMIPLQLLTGMRPGEVIQMTMRSIDTTGPVWIYTPPRHKTSHHGKARRVYIGPKAQDNLRPWLRTSLDEPLFQPIEAEAERSARRRAARATPLWPPHVARYAAARKERLERAKGDIYTVASYRRAIARACAEAGIPAWSPHGLRHAAASELRRQFGEEVTRLVLGHSRLDTTRLYGEVDQVKAAEAMGKIG
jgi:integrase